MQLLYFTAPWCVPCRSFGPVMAEISKTRRVVKIDVDEFPDLASMFNVFSVPTVILLDGVDLDGGAELGRFPGARSQEFVEDFIASLA